MPEPLPRLGLNVFINPLFGLGSQRAEQEKCAFILNENIGGGRP